MRTLLSLLLSLVIIAGSVFPSTAEAAARRRTPRAPRHSCIKIYCPSGHAVNVCTGGTVNHIVNPCGIYR